MQLLLGYANGAEQRLLPVRVTGSRTDVAGARGLPAPDYVLLNGGGRAYGELHLDPFSLSWLSSSIDEIQDPLTRGSAWVTLWDAVLDGELPATRFVDLITKALPREGDELNVQRVLGYLRRAFWIYLSPAERLQRIRPTEQLLNRGLSTATTVSLRSSYFSALRDVAGTPATLEWLSQIWRGDTTVEGLPLAENDFIVLAEELAVRGVRGWKEILDGQIARTLNPDRKARLQFVAPALSMDAAERGRFFASLSDVANRRREPWVLDGLQYLHHPLRADASIRYIQPSLALLQEIQQTGDIFFPKRWMDSTLGGHQSAEAAQIVRAFLDNAGQAYPDRLRRTILSSADDLFRASRK